MAKKKVVAKKKVETKIQEKTDKVKNTGGAVLNQNVRHNGVNFEKGTKITDAKLKKLFGDKGYLGKISPDAGFKTDKGVQSDGD